MSQNPRVEISVPDGASADVSQAKGTAIECRSLSLYYGDLAAIKGVDMDIRENQVTALIGPSGCGKSTFLRALNRMNDFIEGFSMEGSIRIYGEDIYAPSVDPVDVRLRVGMVFQSPNPFPKSIFENVSLGPRLNGYTGDLEELVVTSLQNAYLWDEVKDKLKESAYSLSGGQKQRLCIARAIAMQPDVLLMDEPTSALDPVSTSRIEELIAKLKENYTILIVTHNMQQAARIGDATAFFYKGELIEYDKTLKIFTNPARKTTEEYITGRFG